MNKQERTPMKGLAQNHQLVALASHMLDHQAFFQRTPSRVPLRYE